MLRATLCLALVIAAGAVTGCGSGSASGGSDPASVVPAGALLYAEATVRPEGDARAGALAAARKVLRTGDPAARLRQLVGDAVTGDGQARIDYARDIEPWVGDRAALWLDAPPRAGAEPSGAAAIVVRDEDAARSKIEELVERGGDRWTQKGDYEVTGSGDALAVRDGYAYFGDEAAVRRALGADDHLADSDAYRHSVDDLPGERLATYFIDTPRFFDAMLAADPEAAQRLGPVRSLLAQDAHPIAGAFMANADRLTVENVTAAGGSALGLGALTGGEAPALMRDLPGDSWAAFGVPDAGAALRTTFGLVAGAFGGAAVESRLRQELGLDLEQDVFSWMGDAAVFVRGATKDALDGALVVQVTDEARAAQSFGKLVGLVRTRGGLDAEPVRVPGADAAFDLGVRDAPKPVILARGHGRVVLALGRAAAAAGLAPSRRLGDSAVYSDAQDALGGYDPSMLVSMRTLVPLLTGDAEIVDAKPYLEAFDVIAAGARREGDDVRSRLAAGLRP